MKKPFLLLLLSTSFLSSTEYGPYFGGTLLSTIPTNIAPGHFYLEPYLYITRQFSPTSYTYLQNTWEFETGITPWLDIALYPNFYSSHFLGDTQVALGFQILRESSNTPALRFLLQENFPTGKYDRLSHLSDATGTGAYQTFLSAVLYKTVLPCTLNLSIDYILSSTVTPHGLNIYHTHHTFRPAPQLVLNLGTEYSITTTTILGLDIHYLRQSSSYQFSLAPCIEYNPSPNVSFEAGPWFTISNHNTPSFASAVLTAYWLF